MSRLARITSDPSVCHGQPTVRGLRYPVAGVLDLLTSGMTSGEILEDFSDLERDDLLAAIEFNALASESDETNSSQRRVGWQASGDRCLWTPFAAMLADSGRTHADHHIHG